jgi:uncharacterized protein
VSYILQIVMNPNYHPPDCPPKRTTAVLGLLSDTHYPERLAHLPPALFDVLAGVDLLLHAGDVGTLDLLTQLSRIAPVVAVHGNDDTTAATSHLPEKQLVTIVGQPLLLWHSHYADRAEELASRRDGDLRPKLARIGQAAQAAGATLVHFGHWHIPLVYQYEDVTIINAGGLASGNEVTTQTIQTVALLFMRDDKRPFVTHVDLAQPDQPFVHPIDWDAGFTAVAQPFSHSILAPDLRPLLGIVREKHALQPDLIRQLLLPLAHRCWSGEQRYITRADILTHLNHPSSLPPALEAEIRALLL